jgi:hypothetical protein
MTNQITVIPVREIQVMAQAIASSGLFGITSESQALALMLIAQAEGLHPAIAARDYHIIKGKPALKADAMLVRFQQSGGSVSWSKYTDAACEATFSHPQGGKITVEWDMARAKTAELGGNAMWKKYPRQMLRARVISEGIRSIFPAANGGLYTPEEVMEFDDKEQKPAQTKKMHDVTPKQSAIKAKVEDVVVLPPEAPVNELHHRFDMAKAALAGAESEERLNFFTSSKKYQNLLDDLDGDLKKGELMNFVTDLYTKFIMTAKVEQKTEDQ